MARRADSIMTADECELFQALSWTLAFLQERYKGTAGVWSCRFCQGKGTTEPNSVVVHVDDCPYAQTREIRQRYSAKYQKQVVAVEPGTREC